MRDFYSLLRSIIFGTKLVQLLTMLINNLILSIIRGKLSAVDWKAVGYR
jgi:hypothetical protein